jgi:hypothetical protein
MYPVSMLGDPLGRMISMWFLYVEEDLTDTNYWTDEGRALLSTQWRIMVIFLVTVW